MTAPLTHDQKVDAQYGWDFRFGTPERRERASKMAELVATLHVAELYAWRASTDWMTVAEIAACKAEYQRAKTELANFRANYLS